MDPIMKHLIYFFFRNPIKEEFEDTKGVIRIRKSKKYRTTPHFYEFAHARTWISNAKLYRFVFYVQ
jgi:hypothetical protein